MSGREIPPWNGGGVLPPLGPDPISPDRSPYVVSLIDFVLRFSDTQQRRKILAGFLRYRAGLHAAGLVDGFQWVDGSFLEQIELLEGRAPNDIDLVTFYRMPQGKPAADVLRDLGEFWASDLDGKERIKRDHHVDAYFVSLALKAESLVRHAAYWYSMWSHRRTEAWKGYLQIDLGPTDDADALQILNANKNGNEP